MKNYQDKKLKKVKTMDIIQQKVLHILGFSTLLVFTNLGFSNKSSTPTPSRGQGCASLSGTPRRASLAREALACLSISMNPQQVEGREVARGRVGSEPAPSRPPVQFLVLIANASSKGMSVYKIISRTERPWSTASSSPWRPLKMPTTDVGERSGTRRSCRLWFSDVMY